MEGALAVQLARAIPRGNPPRHRRRSSRGERTKSSSCYPRDPGKVHRQPTLSDSTRAEFKAGKLSKVTFKYGFPQYAKPAAAASKQLGFKVGKEHETVVLTRGKDGRDEYKARLRLSTPARRAERTRTHDRSRPRAGHRQHGVPQAGRAERDEVRVGQGEAVSGGAKVYEVTRRHSWRRRAPERRV